MAKATYISYANFLIGTKLFKFGDVVSNGEEFVKAYPYLFELMPETPNFDEMTLSDLQNYAKQHSIDINKKWNKKILLVNIKKAINE